MPGLVARAECPAGRHTWIKDRRVCEPDCIYHEARFCNIFRCATCGVGRCNRCQRFACEHLEE
jgi:hypothetical protein